MKDKLYYLGLILLFFILIYLLNYYQLLISTCVINTVNLWLQVIVPTIYPTIIVINIIIANNINNLIPNHVYNFFNRIFHFDGPALIIYILGVIAGTPTTSLIIKNYYENNLFSKKSAEKLLGLVMFNNPVFILAILNNLFVSNIIKIKLLAILYLLSLVIALLIKGDYHDYHNCYIFSKKRIIDIIIESFKIIINILGIMIFMAIISLLVSQFIKNKNIAPLLYGFLEITNGISLLNIINDVFYRGLFLILILSFGGISILLQIKSIIANTNLSFKTIVGYRILYAIAAGICFCAIA